MKFKERTLALFSGVVVSILGIIIMFSTNTVWITMSGSFWIAIMMLLLGLYIFGVPYCQVEEKCLKECDVKDELKKL